MGTLGVAIVGGPLTMTFLVLESTGDLGVAGGVLAACIATSLTVRATFGYSFATWRLHLRGESIRGAQDVGWLRDLTVGRLMVRSPPTFPAKGTVRAFREAYPLGSAHVVVAVDEAGRYRGLIGVPEAHALTFPDDDDGGSAAAIVRMPQTTLHPDVDVRSALSIFDAAAADTLAVTDRATAAVIGTLSESFAARRYAQETSRRQGVLGGGAGRARNRSPDARVPTNEHARCEPRPGFRSAHSRPTNACSRRRGRFERQRFGDVRRGHGRPADSSTKSAALAAGSRPGFRRSDDDANVAKPRRERRDDRIDTRIAARDSKELRWSAGKIEARNSSITRCDGLNAKASKTLKR